MLLFLSSGDKSWFIILVLIRVKVEMIPITHHFLLPSQLSFFRLSQEWAVRISDLIVFTFNRQIETKDFQEGL